MRDYCCERLGSAVEHRCEQHPDPFDCPDHLIWRSEDGSSLGLIVHDGGGSYVQISYCPWCGSQVAKA